MANLGQILWTDLTIKNATEVKAFYEEVIGWKSDAVSMGEYDDYSMIASGDRPAPMGDGKTIAGVCHAKGPNADMPAQWILYVGVADLDTSLAKTKELGGEQVGDIKSYGEDRFAVIKDPAGAAIGLYQQAE